MTIMSKRGSEDNVITYEHYCDTIEDRDQIDPKYITLGTTCIVITNQGVEAYIADSNKQWHLV